MNLLFIGDIVGRPGRDMVQKGLGALVEHYDIDCTIANAENSAAGFGITRDIGAQYVITYRPKRPLSAAKPGEYRRVEVAARRVGLYLRSRKGYVVLAQE